MATRRIDTRTLIDENRVGGYQVSIFLLCFLAMMVDGYDVQISGVAAAGVRETLKLDPATLGLVITAGQLGIMLGTVLLQVLQRQPHFRHGPEDVLGAEPTPQPSV